LPPLRTEGRPKKEGTPREEKCADQGLKGRRASRRGASKKKSTKRGRSQAATQKTVLEKWRKFGRKRKKKARPGFVLEV